MIKIYADKGHDDITGFDPGAVNGSLREGTMNIITAEAFAKRMMQYDGYEVKLEQGNQDITSSALAANSYGADFIISFHENAGGGDRGEVIHSWKDGSLEFANAIAEGLKKAGQTQVNVFKSKANSSCTAEYFGILRTATMPGVIVEPCFIDNANDRQLADTVEEQSYIGYCIADAIAISYGGKLKESEDDEMVRYPKLSDIPNDYGFRDVVEKLMNAKIINGDGSDPTGNNDVIDLSHDQVRSLVFEYHGGAFDRKLKAAGLDPAVPD
ncbi:MAG TPA: N-acetylmuramoyl-L-alanine amidase [Syntrophomonadaceae bacterium]|nr:N-acetylmuramoyl-L-alanine amidase [Syntrophomonadaceae bacterium]